MSCTCVLLGGQSLAWEGWPAGLAGPTSQAAGEQLVALPGARRFPEGAPGPKTTTLFALPIFDLPSILAHNMSGRFWRGLDYPQMK